MDNVKYQYQANNTLNMVFNHRSNGVRVYITNHVVDPTNCPPASPDMGDVWMDWDDINHQFNVKIWDGSGWDDIDLSIFDDISSDSDEDWSVMDLIEPEETPEQAYDRAMGVLK